VEALESLALVTCSTSFGSSGFSASLFVSLEVSLSLMLSAGYFLAGEDDLFVSS